mgnify:CR=1 FL=1
MLTDTATDEETVCAFRMLESSTWLKDNNCNHPQQSATFYSQPPTLYNPQPQISYTHNAALPQCQSHKAKTTLPQSKSTIHRSFVQSLSLIRACVRAFVRRSFVRSQICRKKMKDHQTTNNTTNKRTNEQTNKRTNKQTNERNATQRNATQRNERTNK